MIRGIQNRRTAPTAFVVAAGLMALAATGLALADAQSARAEDDNGIGISITVPTSTPTPAPSATAAPATGKGSTSTTGSTRSGTTGAVNSVAPASTTPVVPAADTVDLGGKLFISGLSSNSVGSINPFAGEIVATFTVRNISTETFDSSVRFWADGPFGNELSQVRVKIDELKPDESRTVTGTLTGIGQWTFIQVHAAYTPPKTLDGIELASATRDQFVFVPPWLVVGGGAFAAAGFAGVRAVRLRLESVAPLVGASA
jgi:hypothetical protein